MVLIIAGVGLASLAPAIFMSATGGSIRTVMSKKGRTKFGASPVYLPLLLSFTILLRTLSNQSIRILKELTALSCTRSWNGR